MTPAVLTYHATEVMLMAQRKAIDHNRPWAFRCAPNGPTPWSAIRGGFLLHRYEWSGETGLWSEPKAMTAEEIKELLGEDFRPELISQVKPYRKPRRKLPHDERGWQPK